MDVSEEVESGPLDGVRFENGAFVFEDEPVPVEGESGASEKLRGAVRRLYNDEKFHRHIVRLFGWFGRKQSLNSLRVGDGNEDFRTACDILYGILDDSLFGPVIDYLADDTIEKLILLFAGFGPPILGTFNELRERQRQREVSQAEKPGVDKEVSGDE